MVNQQNEKHHPHPHQIQLYISQIPQWFNRIGFPFLPSFFLFCYFSIFVVLFSSFFFNIFVCFCPSCLRKFKNCDPSHAKSHFFKDKKCFLAPLHKTPPHSSKEPISPPLIMCLAQITPLYTSQIDRSGPIWMIVCPFSSPFEIPDIMVPCSSLFGCPDDDLVRTPSVCESTGPRIVL